eukprot:s1325_g4.t1
MSAPERFGPAAAAAALLAAWRYGNLPAPELRCDGAELQKLLEDDSTGRALQTPYWPHWLHCHWVASTATAAIKGLPIPRSFRSSEEVYLKLEDGGTVSLDWWKGVAQGRPVVLVLPGMANSSRSIYIRYTMDRLYQAGFQPVAMNFRGVEHLESLGLDANRVVKCLLCSTHRTWRKGSALQLEGLGDQTPAIFRLFGANPRADLPKIIDNIQATCPQQPIFAIGFSMGGTMLAKYLGEFEHRSRIAAGVIVSSPLAYPGHQRELEQRTVLSFLMAQPLKARAEKRDQIAKLWPKCDMGEVMKSTSLLHVVGYMLDHQGYHTPSDYFTLNDPEPVLGRIKCPVLILGAKDDPTPGWSLRKQKVEATWVGPAGELSGLRSSAPAGPTASPRASSRAKPSSPSQRRAPDFEVRLVGRLFARFCARRPIMSALSTLTCSDPVFEALGLTEGGAGAALTTCQRDFFKAA